MKSIALFFVILGGLAILGEEYTLGFVLFVIAYLVKD